VNDLSDDFELPHQLVDRSLIPTFQFQKEDVVITLGQDGVVANTAKYVGAQPIVAVNPEPGRFDGILLPFLPNQARSAVALVVESRARIREITLAEVKLEDGQQLLASLSIEEEDSDQHGCTGLSRLALRN
jgi:NAD kinase